MPLAAAEILGLYLNLIFSVSAQKSQYLRFSSPPFSFFVAAFIALCLFVPVLVTHDKP